MKEAFVKAFKDIKNYILIILVIHVSYNGAILQSEGKLLWMIGYTILFSVLLLIALYIVALAVRGILWTIKHYSKEGGGE